jgi:hypothetical protein
MVRATALPGSAVTLRHLRGTTFGTVGVAGTVAVPHLIRHLVTTNIGTVYIKA